MYVCREQKIGKSAERREVSENAIVTHIRNMPQDTKFKTDISFYNGLKRASTSNRVTF